MKKKQLIISLSLAVILFSILFQSLHTYGHFVKAFFQTECHHKHNGTTAQITHKHHSFDCVSVPLLLLLCSQRFWPTLISNYKVAPYFYKTARAIVSFQVVCILQGPPLV
jgi:hypothetical protein